MKRPNVMVGADGLCRR